MQLSSPISNLIEEDPNAGSQITLIYSCDKKKKKI